MSNQPAKHDQLSLTLRLAAGGYLLYSAWKIRGAVAENPFFLVAIIVFIIAGAFIVGHAALRLIKGQYAKPGEEETEETEESNE